MISITMSWVCQGTTFFVGIPFASRGWVPSDGSDLRLATSSKALSKQVEVLVVQGFRRSGTSRKQTSASTLPVLTRNPL